MVYLAYIAFLFMIVQLVNTFINVIFIQKLKPSGIPHKEIVSVLIPARNEEDTIALLLSDIQKLKTQNIEILVLDDQSTDKTAKIVQGFSIQDHRIKLITSELLPKGWLGKNYACHQLAKNANGKQYLFIDADVRIEGNVIYDAIDYLKKHKLGLFSIFPTQRLSTIGEKFSVPVMNYILLTLLPLIFVRKSPFISHVAANGQFMLFDATVYNKFYPHMLYKKSAVEDIEIARFFKKKKINVACLSSEKRVVCRMYKSYRQAVNGFSKNVFMFFGDKPVFAFLFWILASLGVIPVLLYMPSHVLIYFIGVLKMLFFYSITSRQNAFINILFFPVHLIFLLQIMINGLLTKSFKTYQWKGRNIY